MRPNASHMTLGRTILILALCTSQAFGQKVGEGLWNTGRSFAPRPGSDSLYVQKLLARVQIYPGFSVVRTDMEMLNRGKDSLVTGMVFTDSITTSHPFFQHVSNLPPATRLLLVGRDTVDPAAHFAFAPGITAVSVLEITPNHQAILSRGGSVKEGNAFTYSFDPGSQAVSKLLVEFRTGLTLTNVMGVHPSTALTTMSQLSYTPGDRDLVIWYNGSAPDMKMEKKVLPLAQQLFDEMNSFNMAMFGSPEFRPVQQDDFSTNKRSPFVSFLYFIMFSAPWVILVAFLAWLALKPKKKKTNT